MSKILSGVMFVLALLGSSFAWSSEDGARETVIKVVEAFRDNIVADKDVLSKDPALLEERVDAILADVIDFDNFARKIMAKYYRIATPEQRARFARVTKDTLLKTYGTSLLELDADRIKVLPLGPQRKGVDTKVDVNFEMESGGLLNISFIMKKSKAGKWMLDNVVINNINFGFTFRKQFEVMMQQNKNDIELAISAWRESLAKKS